jgi:hypothetical protein
MKILLKKIVLAVFLFAIIIQLNGQVFLSADTIVTDISKISYSFLPVQSNEDFNFLFYSIKNEKKNFELVTIKDTSISKIEIKNTKLKGGGSWYKSAFVSNEILLLLHVDGFLMLYEKNKKGNYTLKKTLNIEGIRFDLVSMLDAENILLMNCYNWYTEEKLYDDYAMLVYNLPTGKVTYEKRIDLGKGILLAHYSLTSMESRKNKIAVAHPTLPFIYIYNENLEPVDTIYAQFHSSVSADSLINSEFTDSFLERHQTQPKEIIHVIRDKKIHEMERVEKVFWLSDDIVGYTIKQAFSEKRMFVFYSVSQKKELQKKIVEREEPYNFISSTRVLLNNNKTIWYGSKYNDDESDIYYLLYLYDKQPFDGTE